MDPKALLTALLEGGALPHPSPQLLLARRLARDLASAAPAELSSLPADLQLALLEASVQGREARVADALTASPEKAVAKAAKKALYQLRSKGLAVPDKKAEAAAPPPQPDPKAEELPAILSAMQGNGEQLLLVPRPVRGGGLEVVQAVVTDELGIVQLTLGDSNRSHFRKQLKLMREEKNAQALEIPRAEAIARLEHALHLNQRAGHPPPEGADAIVRHLGGVPREHPAEIPPPQDGDAALQTAGHTLHDEPELQGWLPPEDELRRLGLKLDEVLTSPLYIDEAQRQAQLSREFVKAAESFFTAQHKRLYAGRLWEVATYLERTGRPRKAEVARAEARRLFHDAPGLFSPFAQRLFEKVLMLTQELQRKGSLGAPQLSKGAPAPEEKKSPGGLIIP